MTKQQLQSFLGMYVSPGIAHIRRWLPARSVVRVLLAYGVGIAREAGISPDELRVALDEAIASDATEIAARAAAVGADTAQPG
jgi:hypothetical protein